MRLLRILESRSAIFPSGKRTVSPRVISLVFFALLSACASEDSNNTNTGLNFNATPTNTDPTTTDPTTDPGNTSDPTTQVIRNNPAIITGVDSASLTEDDDPDGDNLLEASGKLEVSDLDENESLFLAADVANTFGSFNIAENGDWQFSAINDSDLVQSLSSSQTIPIEITVNSFDRTVHVITINISGSDDAAVFSNTDTGLVTEDEDPDGDNLLEVAGKLDIADIDTDESVFVFEELSATLGNLKILPDGNWSYSVSNILLDVQRLTGSEALVETFTVKNAGGSTHDIAITINGTEDPTIISGDDAVTITEDVDPDGDNLLEASGILNITAQIAFVPANITGLYGDFTLDAAGNWTYEADNTQPDVTNLANGLTLTDNLTIDSVNGASHDVVITINSFDISITWTAPLLREDSSTILLSDISVFRIYYGTTPGDYQTTVEVTDTSLIEQTFKSLAPATYYFVMTTVDSEGRESLYSEEAILSNE